MPLSVMMLYIVVFCTSTGIVYNIFGQKAVFFILFVASLVTKRYKLNIKLTVNVLIFFGYFVIKCLLAKEMIRSNDYHSLWTQQVKIIELGITFISLYNIIQNPTIKNNIAVTRNCYKLFLVCYLSTVLLTIIELLTKGRMLYRNSTEEVSWFCAPQSFLFFAIIMSSVILKELLNRTMRSARLGIIIIIVNTVYVLLMSYSTQIFFYFLAMLLVFIFEMKVQKRLLFVMLAVPFFNPYIIKNLLPNLLRLIGSTVFYNARDVQVRINDVIRILQGFDEVGRTIRLRLDVIKISIDSFTHNVLFGVPFASYNVGNTLVVGGHQEWIDNLARYGIVGMAAFLGFIFCGFTISVPFINKKNSANKALLLTFLLYGLFNTFLSFTFVTACVYGLLIQKANSMRRDYLINKYNSIPYNTRILNTHCRRPQ